MKPIPILIRRDFNGKISNCTLDSRVLNSLDFTEYRPLLEKYQENCFLKIITENLTAHSVYWGEEYLCQWFINHYDKLGFDDIAREHTDRYKKLKSKMGFKLRPDFLALREGRWLRVEVENWVHKYYYNHLINYAEVIVSYDRIRSERDEIIFGPKVFDKLHNMGDEIMIRPRQVITFRDYYNIDVLIHMGEIPCFLYLYSEKFQDEYHKLYYYKVLGITDLPS